MIDPLHVSFMGKESLITQENLAQLIANISISLMNVDSGEIDVKIIDVLKIVADAVNAEKCGIFQFSKNGENIYNTHEWAEREGVCKIGSIPEIENRDCAWLIQKVNVLCEKENSGIETLSSHSARERSFLEDLGLSSGFMIPLVARKVPLGFIYCGFIRKTGRALSRLESTFLAVVTKLIANVLAHKQVNDSLASTEKKMQRVIERLSDDYFFYRHNKRGVFTYVSDSITNVLGYCREEFLGHYSKYLTESPVNKRAERATQLSIKGIRQDPYEVEVFHKNGDIITLEVQEISVEYEKGKFIAVEGIAHNITKRKKYEELIYKQKEDLEKMVKERTARLNRMNEQLVVKINQYEEAKKKIDLLVGELEIILDSVPAAIFYKDIHHRFIRVNRSFSRLFGKDKEAFKGKTYFDLGFGHYSAEEFVREDDCVMETGQAKRQTVCKININNVPKWLVIDKIPYHDINGDIIGIIGFALDISDFKNAEELIFSLNKKLTEAEEIERLRISRYLHDTVAQNLSSALIECNILLDEYAGRLVEITPKFSSLSRILHKSVAQIRHLSYDLRPPHFEKMGISNAIYSFCQEFKENYQIKIDFLSAGAEEIEPDFNLQINLYRIVQEALNNIRKHAQAKNVKIRLVASYPDIILRIEDDGKGFHVPSSFDAFLSKKCMGLQGMEERVRLFRGDFRVQSQVGHGTKIVVRLPADARGGRESG
jgi:PAS domain S-box-containing protein